MKYDEFQIWYHTFLATLPARSNTTNTESLFLDCKKIADKVVDVYRTVERPKADMPNVDLDGVLKTVLKTIGHDKS